MITCASNGENPCGTRLFGDSAADQKCIKSSTKNRLFVFTKHGQKVDKIHYFFCTKAVSKTGIMVQAKDHQNASNFGGVSMANSWESVDVGCPFYQASDGIYFQCEGLAGLTMTIYFSDKQRKAVLMGRYCNCRWEDCPFHKEVAALYE